MIVLYVLFCLLVVFPFMVAMTKAHDGEVQLGDLLLCLFSSVFPVVNVLVAAFMIFEVLRVKKLLNKKVF